MQLFKSARLALSAIALFAAGSAQALCPWNTSYDSTLNFCTDANNAFGPFTRAMTDACVAGGNGSACTGSVNVYFNGTNVTGTAVGVQRWGKSLANSLRGTGTCPRGAVLSANYDNRCVEVTSSFGTEVYGQFPQNYIDKCRQQGNGNACWLNRWSATVYNGVKNAINGGTPTWKLPMPSGFTTSDWCVCRNIGTSPHIGWDLVNNGAMTSVAIEAGKVTYGPALNGGCGWELELTDRFGTVWYYRHLNKPNLVNGQSLTAGATIGLHRDYPLSSCGSGAHLHFERLSSGFFQDSSVSKNCTGTLKSCNYDPRKPFPQFKSLAADPLNLAFDPQSAPVEYDPAQAAIGEVCRVHPTSYAKADASELAGLKAASSDLDVQFASTDRTGSQGFSARILSLAAEFAGNTNNQCSRDQRCITSVTLFAQHKDGSLSRVLTDATVRNSQVAITSESAFCAPADAVSFVAKITDQRGNRYRIDL